MVVLSTLLGFASPYISPNTVWPLAFFGLAMPYFLLANLLFVFYWLFRTKSLFLVSLVVLALGYKSIPKYLQVNFGAEELTEKSFKVMSFNVRVFDLYMWTKEKNTRNQIFDFLKNEDPDILCLQEFYHKDIQHKHYEFKTLDTLIQLLSAKNYHVTLYNYAPRDRPLGFNYFF